MKRISVADLDVLRIADIKAERKDSLLYWIWDARRRGVVSDDAIGFFLTDEQMRYWNACGIYWDDASGSRK